MRETPNYYAIIPASVRYEKRIPAGAKLLYGEITALANSKGFCYATNRYFADLYEVDSRTIKRWIAILNELEFIRYELEKKSYRKIYLLNEKREETQDKNVPHPGQKCPTTQDKNVPPYNITINNKNNNSLALQQETEHCLEEVIDYRTIINHSIKLDCSFTGKNPENYTINWAQQTTAVKSAVKRFRINSAGLYRLLAMLDYTKRQMRLKNDSDAKFWVSLPCLPSSLTDGVVPRLMEIPEQKVSKTAEWDAEQTKLLENWGE